MREIASERKNSQIIRVSDPLVVLLDPDLPQVGPSGEQRGASKDAGGAPLRPREASVSRAREPSVMRSSASAAVGAAYTDEMTGHTTFYVNGLNVGTVKAAMDVPLKYIGNNVRRSGARSAPARADER